MAMLGSPLAPNDELITFGAPLGKTTTSPVSRRTGGVEPSANAAQHVPDITAWNDTTCSTSGMTEAAIWRVSEDSPTQGELASMSK